MEGKEGRKEESRISGGKRKGERGGELVGECCGKMRNQREGIRGIEVE